MPLYKKKLEMLQEQKEMIKLFAYSVSHDLKSPAIAVSGLTQRLKKMYGDQLDEKGRSYCNRIVKTAQGMGAGYGSMTAGRRALPSAFPS
jgi:light-regulated signal transduction histidine kinase (bacteriophytochrome)